MITRINKYIFSRLTLPCVFSFSLLMPLTQLYAVEQNSDNIILEKYEVTGSHIKRLDIEGPAPVIVIDQEEIKLSGASTLNELLKNMTLNTGFMLNENLPLSQTPGAASINMRGLGQDATLILLNGRRTSNFPYTHNNAESFVDLNSIPLAAIDRVEVLKDGASAIYGSDALAGVINIILKNDYNGSEISMSYGVSSKGDADETHVNFIKGISSDKDNLTFVVDYFKRQSFLMSDRSFSRTAFQPDINPTYGNDYTTWDFHPANYYDTGSTFDDFATFTATTMGVNGFFDPNPWITAVPESERIGGVVSYKRDINTDLTFFTDLMLSQVNTSYQFAPTAFWGEYDVDALGNTVALPAAHSSNPEGIDLFLLWRMTDLGPRINDIKTDNIRLVAGFEGIYQDWDWEAAALHAKSKSSLTGKNYASISAIQTAFANDQLNPFGTSTQADLNAVRTTISRDAETTTQGADVKFSGEVGMLSDGPILMAVGVSYLTEDFKDSPDALTAAYDIVGQGFTSGEGNRNSTAIFAELNLPIQDNTEMQLALRGENYSDFGSTINPKVAIKYRPSQNLMLRASVGTAFRAPSLSELHQSDSTVYGTFVDTAACAAAGGVGAACNLIEKPIIVSSNPNLDAEESTSYYLGMLFEPTKKFSVGVDYWNYDQDNIVTNNTQDVVDQNDPSNVIRPGGGVTAIDYVLDQYSNTANRKTDGIDLELKYSWDTSFGRLELKNITTKVLAFKEKIRNADPYKEKSGTYQFPDLRNRLSLLWSKNDFSAVIHANYINSYEDLNYDLDGHKVDSYMAYDGQLTYSGLDNYNLIFGINNILDEEPPFSNASYTGYDESMHSPIGRFYYVRLNHQF